MLAIHLSRLSLPLLWIVAAIHISPWVLQAQVTNGFQYLALSETVWITGYDCGTNKTAQIPGTILGKKVVRLRRNTFFGCGSLSRITLPNTLTEIEPGAFAGCMGLTNITVDPANPSYTSLGGVLFDKDKTVLMFCPSAWAGAYTIPNTVTNIQRGAFNSCSSLTSITIPNSVTTIGDGAFTGCSSLSSIIIPDSVTSIGYRVAWGCINLTSFRIPSNATTIGDSEFTGLSKLTSITIPNGVTNINSYAFQGCSSLTNVTLGNGITSIGWNVFSGCTNLTRLTIPASVTSIGRTAWYGCSKLTNLFFRGNAPTGDSGLSIMEGVSRKSPAHVYYMPGTTGWTGFKVATGVTVAPYPAGIVFAADATAQVVNGQIMGFRILDGGYGYQIAPTIRIVGGSGSGMTATATLNTNGTVTKINVVSAGSGYTSAPSVVMDPPTKIAVATASVVNGFVVGITIADGGQGYLAPPEIQLVGGGGSGATVTARINAQGVVTEINIVHVGRGYTNAPTVHVAPPVVPPTVMSANRVQTLVFHGLNDTVSYDLQKSTTSNSFLSTGMDVRPQNGVFATTSDLFTLRSFSEYFDDSTSYRLVAKPLPTPATGRVRVVNGFVVGVDVLNGGRGYTSAPTVSISDSSGSGAVVTAIMSHDWVQGFTVSNAGRGYSSSAKATIAAPPVMRIAPTSSPALRIGVINLLTNFSYQLQTSTNLSVFRNQGPVFTATNTWQYLYVPIESAQGFGRVRFVQ